MSHDRPRVPVAFRAVCFLCALFFVVMGAFLVGFPEIATRVAGPLHPAVYGILRGAGGSILPYGLLYVLVGIDPRERRWGVAMVALANTAAITLDTLSVGLGEYTWVHAMFDIPMEIVSLGAMIWALTAPWGRAVSPPCRSR